MYASWNQIETWPEQKRLTPTHATMNTILETLFAES